MIKENMTKNEKPGTLEGIIIPTSWDGKGNPTQLSLFTFDEQEYKIDSKYAIKWEIPAFIRKKIRITCRWDKEKKSERYIIPLEICEINRLDK